MLFSDLIRSGAAVTQQCFYNFGSVWYDADNNVCGMSCALGAAYLGYFLESGTELPDTSLHHPYAISGVITGHCFKELTKSEPKRLRDAISKRGYKTTGLDIVQGTWLSRVIEKLNDELQVSREEIADIIVEAKLDINIEVPRPGASPFMPGYFK